jgi:hypothetical protein
MNRFAIMRALIVAAAAASVAATSGAAEKPKDFKFGIPLTVEAESAFYRAALPAAFYAGSARRSRRSSRVQRRRRRGPLRPSRFAGSHAREKAGSGVANFSAIRR